jgi:hypothetical protein
MRGQVEQSPRATGQVQDFPLSDRRKPFSQNSALLDIDVGTVGIAKPVAVVAVGQVVVVFNYSTFLGFGLVGARDSTVHE